jgi:hypothetical protein
LENLPLILSLSFIKFVNTHHAQSPMLAIRDIQSLYSRDKLLLKLKGKEMLSKLACASGRMNNSHCYYCVALELLFFFGWTLMNFSLLIPRPRKAHSHEWDVIVLCLLTLNSFQWFNSPKSSSFLSSFTSWRLQIFITIF